MDDVQFLSKREKVNEVFFNIFNHNVANGQILVMTSDKSPNELEHFEERMKSRFSSGLLIKIGKPDLQTVKTILEEKLKEAGDDFLFSKDAINYIVRRNQSDIRRLEGYLHRILFYAINNLPPDAIISIDIIKKAVQEDQMLDVKEYGYDVDPILVIDEICKAYSIDPKIVRSKSRISQAVLVRHICMYVLRNKFNMPYSQIGSYFNGRDHSTIIDAVKKMEKLINEDVGLKTFIKNLYNKV